MSQPGLVGRHLNRIIVLRANKLMLFKIILKIISNRFIWIVDGSLEELPLWVVMAHEGVALTKSIISLLEECWCVTTPPRRPPHTLHPTSNHSLLGRWSTSGSEGGGERTFLATTRIRSRGQEKIEGQTNKHEQCLGLTQSRRRVCNTTFPLAYMD